MLQSIYYLLFIYLYLSFLGAGLYLLLAPSWLRKPYYLPFAVPVLGSSLLSVLGMYVICLRLHIGALIPVSLTAAGVLLLSGLLAHRREISRTWSELRNIRPRIKHLLVAVPAIICVMLAVLWPAVREGAPTVPFRIGPDQMCNVIEAQFFLSGGTMNSPTEINRFRKDDWIPRLAIEGMRWSFPAALATYNRLLGSPHTYRVGYPAIALHLIFLGGLAYCLLYYRFGLSPPASLLGGAAVTLNCNMLNAICEGFWAQVFTMPMFVIMLLALLDLRDTEKVQSRPDIWKSVVLLSLLALPLITAWSEGTQIVLYFWVITLALDLALKRKISKTNLIVPVAALVTLLLAAPVLPMLKQHYINVANHFLLNSGFPQPHWAFPSEILGLSDMYHNFMRWFGRYFVPKTVRMTGGSLIFNTIASIVIIAAFARHTLTSRSLDKPFWLAAPVFVTLILLASRLSGHHNFLYMKSYTLFVPLLFTCFYGLQPSSDRFKPIYDRARYVLSAIIIVVGLSYVHGYSATSTYVTNDMMELHAYSHSTDLTNAVFMTRGPAGLSPEQRYRQYMLDLLLCPIIGANVLDQWIVVEPKYRDQHFERHFRNHVYLLLRKSDLPSWPPVERKAGEKIVWQNNTFAIIDTGRLFRDAFTNERSEPDLKVFWETIELSRSNPRGGGL